LANFLRFTQPVWSEKEAPDPQRPKGKNQTAK
jgi:hypothetical protein